ncbi:nitrogenase component 1 [Pectinatus frisingensis]
MDQFVDRYAKPNIKRRNGLINVWSELPFQNTFWRGDLDELKRILEGAGFEVNILVGNNSGGAEEWKRIPEAQFNLVVSPWLGLSIAQYLETKYKQPYLHIPVLPIGAEQTAEFLRKVAEFSGVNIKSTNDFIAAEEKEYYYYLEHFTDFYAEYWWGLPSSYAVVGDSAYNLAINKFLVKQLGLIPSTQIITDNPPEKYRQMISAEYKKLDLDVSTKVVFLENGCEINDLLQHLDYGHRPPIIFGTTWERDTTKKVGGSIVEVGFPASYEVVLNKKYIGYRGALSLLEKIFTTVISKSA